MLGSYAMVILQNVPDDSDSARNCGYRFLVNRKFLNTESRR